MSGQYTIELHQHRLAAWDAATSARVRGICSFSVRQGAEILEASGFNEEFSSPDVLPSPADLDMTHKQWREEAIAAAEMRGLSDFSHGIAAKLINSYLKVRFVCAGLHDHERVKCLHPPIDRVLLTELANRNAGGYGKEWRKFRDHGWSKFDSELYQTVIDKIRLCLPGQPLWMIEEHWAGYQ